MVNSNLVKTEEPTCSKEVGPSESYIGHGLSENNGIHDVPASCLSQRIAVQKDALEGLVAPERV